jgi:competence protein ComEC
MPERTPPDLRLAGLAVGTWLSALAVLRAGAWVGVWTTLGAFGLVACLAAARRGGRAAATRSVIRRAVPGIAAGIGLGIACGAAATAARVAVRDAAEIGTLTTERASVRAALTVTDDPRVLPGQPGRPALFLVRADLHRVQPVGGSALRLDARVIVLGDDPGWRTVLPGQSISVTGRLARPRGGDLRAAVIAVTGPLVLRGPPPWHQRAAGALRAGLRRACAPLPNKPGGLLPGLVVGDVSALAPDLQADFRATGMTHLTAVSGSNIAIVVGAVLMLARWARAGPRAAAALSAVALAGFVILARPSPSVLRAAVMGAIGLVALASARRRAALPALCAAVALLVLVDPELASDAGFALSVLATAGLLLLAPSWRRGLLGRGVPPGIAEALAVPAAAQVACAPVIAALSGSVSLVALPANLLAVPAVAPATILGVLAAVVSPVWPPGAEATAWLGQWPARWLVLVAEIGADAPSGSLPWLPGGVGGVLLAGVLLAVIVAARHPLVRRVAAVVAVAAVVGAVPVHLAAGGWPPTGWVVVACDVGQGDAVILPLSSGRAVVVDAGPDAAAVDDCLHRLGVRSVPLLLVTHFHADHVGGIAGLFRGRTVGQIVTTPWREPAAGRSLVVDIAAAHRTPVQDAYAGWEYADDDVRLGVLGPVERITGSRSDPNNNSLVVRAMVRGVRVLLTGDAEIEEQSGVLARYGADAVRADVLKLAHHGSAYQDVAFLDASRPRVALVSVGLANGYGHPNPAVLDRLARQGTRVLRTDHDGDAAALVAGGQLAVAAHPP